MQHHHAQHPCPGFARWAVRPSTHPAPANPKESILDMHKHAIQLAVACLTAERGSKGADMLARVMYTGRFPEACTCTQQHPSRILQCTTLRTGDVMLPTLRAVAPKLAPQVLQGRSRPQMHLSQAAMLHHSSRHASIPAKPGQQWLPTGRHKATHKKQAPVNALASQHTCNAPHGTMGGGWVVARQACAAAAGSALLPTPSPPTAGTASACMWPAVASASAHRCTPDKNRCQTNVRERHRCMDMHCEILPPRSRRQKGTRGLRGHIWMPSAGSRGRN